MSGATTRPKKKAKKAACKQAGCTTLARRLGFCIRHGGGKCKFPDCSAVGKYKGGVCKTHLKAPPCVFPHVKRGRPSNKSRQLRAAACGAAYIPLGSSNGGGVSGIINNNNNSAAMATPMLPAMIPLALALPDALSAGATGSGGAAAAAAVGGGVVPAAANPSSSSSGLGLGLGRDLGSRRKQASSRSKSRPTRHVTGSAHPGLPTPMTMPGGWGGGGAGVGGYSLHTPHIPHNEMSMDLGWLEQGQGQCSSLHADAAAAAADRRWGSGSGQPEQQQQQRGFERVGAAGAGAVGINARSTPKNNNSNTRSGALPPPGSAAAAAAAAVQIETVPSSSTAGGIASSNAATTASSGGEMLRMLRATLEQELGENVARLLPDAKAVLAQVLETMVTTVVTQATVAAAAATMQGSNPLWNCLQVPQDALQFTSDGLRVLQPPYVAAVCAELGLDGVGGSAGAGGAGDGARDASTKRPVPLRSCFAAESGSTSALRQPFP